MRAASILLFVLVWFSAAWFGSWHWNPNSAVRMFAALSIVEEGDATIDQYAPLTIDKAQFGGHFYLDKAPGMTLMALPTTAIAGWATGERAADARLDIGDTRFDRFMKLRQWLVVGAVNAVLLGLAAVALMDIGRRLTGSAAAGLFAAIGFAMGTPLWGWSTTLFGHAPVAALLVIAVRAILKGSSDDRGRADAAVAGAALGWAMVVEHSAAIFALAIGLWALWRLRALRRSEAVRAASVAIAGGVAAMLPFVAYNLLAFGTPFRLGYQGVVGWDGMEQGLFGLTHPRLAVLGEIIFGQRRGLLWVAPVLVAAVLGVGAAWRGGRRDILLLAIGGAAAAMLYNAAYFYWDGGNSTGPRHAMPAAAFLSLLLPFAWVRAAEWGRRALALLLTASVAINLTIAAAEITAPANIANALIDAVWRDRVAPGYLRTIANEFWRLDPWTGLVIWAVVAAGLFAALCIAVARHSQSSNIYRTNGAARRS